MFFHELRQKIVRRLEQPQNIPSVPVLCPALKLDKSSEIKEEHSLNIEHISITCSVLKLDKLSDFNEEQLLNISCMFVT